MLPTFFQNFVILLKGVLGLALSLSMKCIGKTLIFAAHKANTCSYCICERNLVPLTFLALLSLHWMCILLSLGSSCNAVGVVPERTLQEVSWSERERNFVIIWISTVLNQQDGSFAVVISWQKFLLWMTSIVIVTSNKAEQAKRGIPQPHAWIRPQEESTFVSEL